ncbi:MarR family winged helix-turn-helix transcriptional regulator [Streptomyces sp. NPDC057682]|uniref:MarR family winged helix-turn-helix transcriptional regulator n=1 Tax=unclassified Streptomyces TaxID=2593676 RepID=UPI0036664BF5
MNDDVTPPSLLEHTTYLMSRTGRAARTRLAKRLAERGLRLRHMAVLAALCDFGPHAQRELASRLSIDRGDMVSLVDDLGAHGLLERARDTADRRRMTVTVSPAGREVLEHLLAEASEIQEDVLAPLNARERTQLARLLKRVHDHVQRGEAVRRAGR